MVRGPGVGDPWCRRLRGLLQRIPAAEGLGERTERENVEGEESSPALVAPTLSHPRGREIPQEFVSRKLFFLPHLTPSTTPSSQEAFDKRLLNE